MKPSPKTPSFHSPRGGSTLGSAVAKQLISTAARRLFSSASASSRVQGDERTRSEPLTTQADVRVDYRAKRRRRVSDKAKRKGRRFRSKVMKICDKQLSPIKVIFNGSTGTGSTSSGAQFTLCVGGAFGNTISNSVAAERDFSVMAQGLGDAATSQSNLRFQSCMVEVAMENASSSNDMYVEVYTVKARKLIVGTGTSIATVYNGGWANEPAGLTGGSTLASTTYGATPFLNRTFCELFKIEKKEIVRLAPGNDFNVSLRCKPPRVWNYDKQGAYTTFGDKYTKGFIFVIYGAPGYSASGAPLATSFSYNCVKTYTLVNLRSAGVDASAQVMAP